MIGNNSSFFPNCYCSLWSLLNLYFPSLLSCWRFLFPCMGYAGCVPHCACSTNHIISRLVLSSLLPNCKKWNCLKWRERFGGCSLMFHLCNWKVHQHAHTHSHTLFCHGFFFGMPKKPKRLIEKEKLSFVSQQKKG